MVAPNSFKNELPVLPDEWSWMPISEFLDFRNGLNKAKHFFGYGKPIINYMDVFEFAGIYASQIKGKVDVDVNEIRSFEVRKGDVLFTRTSETVDEVGISCAVLDEVKDTVFSGFVLRGRPKNNKLNNHFKKYVFSSTPVRKQIISKATYTTRALTNGRVLSNVFIPVPDCKKEQQAIAEALSDTDALVTSLEKLIEKKEMIFAGFQNEKLNGQQLGNYTEHFLDDLAIIDPENLSANTDPEYCFEYISLEAVSEGQLLSVKPMTFSHAPSRARRKVRQGDVLFGTVRPNLKSHYFNKNKVDDLICSTGFCVIRPKQDVLNGYFLFRHLMAKTFDTQINKIIAGSNYPAVSSRDVKKLKISLPAISIQHEIASELKDFESEIINLKIQLSKAKKIKAGMMQELLTGRTRLI